MTMRRGRRRKLRVLILGAGTGPAENLIRSLRAGDPSLHLLGAHHDPFPLRKSAAERLYLIPRPEDRDFIGSVGRILENARIHLVVPTSDVEVRQLASGDAVCPAACSSPAPPSSRSARTSTR